MRLDDLFEGAHEVVASDVLALLHEGILRDVFYVDVAVHLGEELLHARSLGISGNCELEAGGGLEVVQFVCAC